MKVTAEIDLPLDVKMLTQAFANLDDEQQARFFIEVADLAKEWRGQMGGASWQWYTVGRHLATCACSTIEARDMVRQIAQATEAT